MTWNEYDAGELEQQYNPRVSVGDPAPYFARYQEQSEQARRELAHESDIAYGDGPLETLDVFPAASPDAPIHVFIHGGYWRSQDKRDYAFIARHLAPAGITTVIPNYDLCPAVTVAEIETELVRCLDFVVARAGRLGGRADRVSVSGHSAGGQLVAALLRDRPHCLQAAVPVSGVFDLEPLLWTSINNELHLDADEARRRSPLRWPAPPATVPLWCLVGGGESTEFRRQTEDYAERAARAGVPVVREEIPDRNHFSVVTELFGGGRWTDRLIGMIRSSG
ncbi:alpha/beta hydrolase [Aquisalimonas lutea]|uniref:alpha/beta hydrolase n=1 Tax=Aquisalimonas lutea TaxID=1327750 RepID=UPI0025B4380D|nr:alpha/beta hydrolase [Aquisalimonas lutea]MDN3519505.1 alpha/beta hydrolase [Aquisalimonas lutea]